MKECRDYKDRLILFHHELLDEKETRLLQFHIDGCPECKKTLARLRIAFQPPKEIEPPNNLKLILRRAKEIEAEESEKRQKLVQFLVLQNIASFIRKNARIAVPAALVALILAFSPLYMKFFVKPAPVNARMYLVSAFGKIDINGKSFERYGDIEYPVNRDFRIKVGDGECILQIDKDKEIMLKSDTDIRLIASDVINIDLANGELAGKVIKGAGGKKLAIKAGDRTFNIVGTVFSVKKDGNDVLLKVKEGTVKCGIKDKEPVSVTKDEKLVIRDNNISKDSLRTDETAELNAIEKAVMISDAAELKKVYINAYPYGSDIFEEGKFVGKSPAFALVDKNASLNYTIRKDGYTTVTMNVSDLGSSKKIELPKIETKTVKNNKSSETQKSESSSEENVQSEDNTAVENTVEKPVIMENGEIDISNIRWRSEADSRGSRISIRDRSELEGRICTVAKYEFGSGKWVQLVKDMRVNALGLRSITFDFIDTNPLNNTLKLRMTDYDGSLFGTTIDLTENEEDATPDTPKKIEWKHISFDLNELSYLGGGDIKLDLENLTRFVLTLEKDQGGDGKIGIRNLIFKK